MTAQTIVVFAIALTAVMPAGCHRIGNTPPTPSSLATPTPAPVATAPVAPDAPERNDYRTLSRTDLASLIRTKTGLEVGPLVPGGLNHYMAQIMSPDGTPLPLEVTVEAERIICDTKTPAGSTRQVITPQGVQSGLDIR